MSLTHDDGMGFGSMWVPIGSIGFEMV